jgi:hypothetical protein
VRPAVISTRTREALEDYRGFRHVVRNVYTFQFDAAKVRLLVKELLVVFAQVRAEMLAFADFLEQRSQADTRP